MEGVSQKRLLVLSVGYGQGHHSAATALAQYYRHEGWQTRVADVCEMSSPRVFRATQLFYQFCVRRAPWLWGVTYSLTDTADWKVLVRTPVLKPALDCLRKLLISYTPDLIICTYPLFAYMLDELQARGEMNVPYAVVVTDALEISRPWMCSEASLVIVPDELSARLVGERYVLPDGNLVAAGFPVRREFAPSARRGVPGRHELKILYGAYRQTRGVIDDVSAIMRAFPQCEMTLLAGHRADLLRKECQTMGVQNRVTVLSETCQMADLLREHHIYVGKAGAATMFECYASRVPVLVNFTLPGQEQGNLQLLVSDGAGCHVESTTHLVDTIDRLLEGDAAGWQRLCQAMSAASRERGAERVAKAIFNKFGV